MNARRKPNRSNRKTKSSRARNRRLAQQQANKLSFDKLEDRQLLASVTVGNATDLVNADTSSILTLINNDGGDGISLREAITASNNTVGEDAITFDASLSGQTITLGGMDIDITEAVTIDATTLSSDVTIDGNQQSRIFDITAARGDFTLAGLTLTGGQTSDDDPIYSAGTNNGGAIQSLSSGDLTLNLSTIVGNSTSGYGAAGGGVFALGSVYLNYSNIIGNSTTGRAAGGGGVFSFDNVVLNHSDVNGNSTAGDGGAAGGGISARDFVTLTQSTVSGNSTMGSSGRGGGIQATRGITLVQSTVSGNSTAGEFSAGGGISSGELTLFQSTVSENSTAGNLAIGGGIAASGDVTITQSTITNNQTSFSTTTGGGISVTNGDPITIIGSILTGNTAVGGMPDLMPFGSFLTVYSSLIGTGVSLDAGASSNNILDDNPLLAPLADNGGPTQTHALLPGSPAIDAGSTELAVNFDGLQFRNDQRGPGFDRVFGSSIDIGAFELQPPSVALIPPTVISTAINEGGVLARPDLLNTFTVVFDTDVTVSAEDLTLVNELPFGSSVDLTGIGFSYDPLTHTAIWDFTTIRPLEAGFYSFQLDADSIANENFLLDGNGDAIGGDDFEDQHYVAISGDANLDGTVDVVNDAFTLVSNLGTTSEASFAVGDFNGDGQVNVFGDAFLLVSNLNRSVDLLTGLIVTNATDVVNADTSSVFALIANDGGDGISLREAIVASNNTTGEDTITFTASLSGQTITLGGTDIDITETVTIDATSLANDVTIDGNQESRIFDFTAPTGDFTLAGLTLTGGQTLDEASDTDPQSGGAIHSLSRGNLFVDQSTITGNSTTSSGADGGGIYSLGGVTLLQSTISNNSTQGVDADGGGIAARGSVLLNDSIVSGNSTQGLASYGGGISVFAFFDLDNPFDLSESNVTLINSTVSENISVEGEGGGIFTSGFERFDVIPGNVTLTNSSVSGNVATSSGGIGAVGAVTLTQSTVSGNSAVGGSYFRGGGGGGISGDSVTLIQSAVTGNTSNSSSSFGSGGGGIRSNDVALYQSTVSGNSVTGLFSDGGGIFAAGTVTLNQSTVTDNYASDSTAPRVAGFMAMLSATTRFWLAIMRVEVILTFLAP